MRLTFTTLILDLCILQSTLVVFGSARRHRSVKPLGGDTSKVDQKKSEMKNDPVTNNIDFIWSTQTVAVGDTAVLHCSFDAIFSQLRNGNIDWMKEKDNQSAATLVATGKKVVLPQRRYRVFRPHNSALSVLIIRRTKKRDAGIYRCNLSGSSTRHKYLILNVTESKIEAQTSPAELKARIGKDITLWCNATGYPRPVVYWTREDRNRKLPDGSYQLWGNGLFVHRATETDTGLYACYLDNFVQPVVSYKFSLTVEDRPWHLDGFKMRFDRSQWYPYNSLAPKPVQGKSYFLMCETRGLPKPLPKIRWYKDDKELRNNKHFYVIEDQPDWRPGYISSTLVIIKFVPRHQANYTCIASNHYRTRVKEFVIHGYEPYMKGSNKEENLENFIENAPRPSKGQISNSLQPGAIPRHDDTPFVVENDNGHMEVDVINFLRNSTTDVTTGEEMEGVIAEPPSEKKKKKRKNKLSKEERRQLELVNEDDDYNDDEEEEEQIIAEELGLSPEVGPAPPDDEDFSPSGSGSGIEDDGY